MIVVLGEELFDDELADDVLLIAVIGGSKHGRYKVKTRPAYRPRAESALRLWLDRQSPNVRAALEIALEAGLKAAEYGGANEPVVLVEHRETPHWPDRFEHGPAKLPLDAASALLKRPLRLLLESGRNDWGFLRKVVPSAWRERWTRAEKHGWIEQQHGGGVTEMRKIIAEQIAADDLLRARTWALFDSDARSAGRPSEQSELTRAECENWGVAYHQLRRRAIENYLPREVLFDWAKRPQKKSKRHMQLDRVKAFTGMNDEQRHHYNMKGGFAADERSELGVSIIYDRPRQIDRKGPLRHGLAADIAQEIWGTDHYEIDEMAFLNDGFEPERVQLFQSLFGRM